MNNLTVGETVPLPNEIVWTESWRRFICLIAQHKPNVRDILLIKLSLATWEHFQAYLQVVVHIEKGIMERDRVHWDAVFNELGSHALLQLHVV